MPIPQKNNTPRSKTKETCLMLKLSDHLRSWSHLLLHNQFMGWRGINHLTNYLERIRPANLASSRRDVYKRRSGNSQNNHFRELWCLSIRYIQQVHLKRTEQNPSALKLFLVCCSFVVVWFPVEWIWLKKRRSSLNSLVLESSPRIKHEKRIFPIKLWF